MDVRNVVVSGTDVVGLITKCKQIKCLKRSTQTVFTYFRKRHIVAQAPYLSNDLSHKKDLSQLKILKFCNLNLSHIYQPT